MNIKDLLAPHSPNFEMGDDKKSCLCVVDGRKLSGYEEEEYLMEVQDVLEKAASDFLGMPAILVGGISASDCFCGIVHIFSFRKEEK